MDSRLRGNDETCPREGGDEISACHSRKTCPRENGERESSKLLYKGTYPYLLS